MWYCGRVDEKGRLCRLMHLKSSKPFCRNFPPGELKIGQFFNKRSLPNLCYLDNHMQFGQISVTILISHGAEKSKSADQIHAIQHRKLELLISQFFWPLIIADMLELSTVVEN